MSALNFQCDIAKGQSIAEVFLISVDDLKRVDGELKLKRKYGKHKRKIFRVDNAGFSAGKKIPKKKSKLIKKKTRHKMTIKNIAT